MREAIRGPAGGQQDFGGEAEIILRQRSDRISPPSNSGSTLADSAVEPTMSANNTVT
jgi:hypothetical protein